VGRPKEHEAAHEARLSSSSSFSERTALTGAVRNVVDVTEERVEWVGGMAEMPRRQSGQEKVFRELGHRNGEAVTDTSSASAAAMQTPQ
jgi:hypothetical protein